jgi:hypothetical protein
MSEGNSRQRRSRILVVIFILVAVLSAIYGAFVFKQMIDDRELQERLDEVRRPTK